jgi:putative transposase
MTEYRRNWSAGGTYFFTVVAANRAHGPLIEHIDKLREAFRTVRHDHPFQIDAIVILPDHLHAIWTLPPEDFDYALRWKKIKAKFSRSMPKQESRSASRKVNGERGIWQRRYWEHTIRDDEDFQTHFDYIHFNPVKHGHVRFAREWPYSTFEQSVNQGRYPVNWGGTVDDDGDFGE